MSVEIYLDKTLIVTGLPGNLARFLSAKLTFDNPEFITALQRGDPTDGLNPHIYLYSYSGEDQLLETPVGSYKLLVTLLKNHNLDYNVSNHLSSKPAVYPRPDVVLRDYQVAPVNEAIQIFEENPSFILQADTGSGKTVMALYMAMRMGAKTLWLTDKDALFSQAKKRIEEFLGIPEEEIGEIVGTTWRIGPQVTVGMIPTLYNRDLSDIRHEFGFVVVDECVLVPTKRCYKVVNELAPAKMLGLTAFAERGDGLTEAIFRTIGDIEVSVPSAGVIYPMVIKRPTNRRFYFNPAKHKRLPFLFERQIVGDKERNELIIRDIGLHNEQFTTIVLSKSVKHLEMLKREVEKRFGAKATITHSNTKLLSSKQRKVNEEAFLNGEYNVMFATYGMLGTGYDYPRLDRLVWACPFSSEGWAYQSLGRPSRTFPGKKGAIVLDYLDNCDKLEYQSSVRDGICHRKGLRVVTRGTEDYLTDEDKDFLFSKDDGKKRV